MNLYLDTEFNGHGGPLLSLALARGDGGDAWYGVWSIPFNTIVPWVAENVVPHLYAFDPNRGSDALLRSSLHAYLSYVDDGDLHIYADWPADFHHFTRLLCGPSFDTALSLSLSMHLLMTPLGQPKPKLPHNALSDAIALMEWHQGGGW